MIFGTTDGSDRCLCRNARGALHVATNRGAAPRLLEHDGVGTRAVISCDGSPEASPVSGIYSLEPGHVNWVALKVMRAVTSNHRQTRATRWRRQGRTIQSKGTGMMGRRRSARAGAGRMRGGSSAGRSHGIAKRSRGHQRSAVGMRLGQRSRVAVGRGRSVGGGGGCAGGSKSQCHRCRLGQDGWEARGRVGRRGPLVNAWEMHVVRRRRAVRSGAARRRA